MQKINIALSNLPVLIIYWWFALLTISHTDFYYKYYILINDIDTYILFIGLLHLIVYSKFYSIKKIIFVVSILIILQIQLMNIYLNNICYFTMYSIAVLIPILCQICSIKKKL